MLGALTLAAAALGAPHAHVVAPCEWTAPSGHRYDFTKLVRPSGSDYSVPDVSDPSGRFTFHYNFCGGVAPRPSGGDPDQGCGPDDAACQHDSVGVDPEGEYYSLGKVSTAKWSENADGVTIAYTGGSPKWLNIQRQVHVRIMCNKGSGPNVYGPGYEDPNVLQNGLYYINISAREACTTPPPGPPPRLPATCQELLYNHPGSVDGQYTLMCPVAGVELHVWCAGMRTGNPREFITLGSEGNSANYMCGPSCRQRHPTSATVITKYNRIRINPCTLMVDVQDRTFAYSSGSITHGDTTITTVPFAVAQSCEGSSRQYPGEALVDLTGTGLAVNSTWVSQGETPYCDVAKHVENQIAEIDGGGLCGSCAPQGWQPFAPPSTPQFVLKLMPVGGPPPPAPPAVKWELADGVFAGVACTNYCSQKGPNVECVENAWPSTLADFERILSTMPNAQCSSVQPGNYPSNPQRSTSSGPGICYWDGGTSEPMRCPLRPSFGHARFCPCATKS